MKDFIKAPDENLEYLGHETDGDIVRMRVVSARKAVACPYCGALPENVRSYYARKFRDLPVKGKRRRLHCATGRCVAPTRHVPAQLSRNALTAFPGAGERQSV